MCGGGTWVLVGREGGSGRRSEWVIGGRLRGDGRRSD